MSDLQLIGCRFDSQSDGCCCASCLHPDASVVKHYIWHWSNGCQSYG